MAPLNIPLVVNFNNPFLPLGIHQLVRPDTAEVMTATVKRAGAAQIEEVFRQSLRLNASSSFWQLTGESSGVVAVLIPRCVSVLEYFHLGPLFLITIDYRIANRFANVNNKCLHISGNNQLQEAKIE